MKSDPYHTLDVIEVLIDWIVIPLIPVLITLGVILWIYVF